jgi:hypothetical protein
MMKKALFPCFIAILLTGTITGSYSQSSNSTAKAGSSHEEFISSTEEINTVKDSASIRLNELNTRAVRNFTRDYKNVTDAKWFKLSKGYFVVYFTMDGIKTTAVYNNGGYCERIFRDYREDKLPRQIRHLVKSTYYDFSIYLVHEVTINDITAYVVIMKDKTPENKISWKIIKVADGEMEVIKEYSEKINHED